MFLTGQVPLRGLCRACEMPVIGSILLPRDGLIKAPAVHPIPFRITSVHPDYDNAI